MKNLHIISSNKPSRLVKIYNDVNRETFTLKLDVEVNDSFKEYVNVYIISDEEIKEEDWCIEFTPNNEKITELFKCNEEQVLNISTGTDYKYKKIILTTHPDLIKDGVQEIDDEFLEWFVKNPDCKWVEVKSIKTLPALQLTGNPHLIYKTIIPKEELPKDEIDKFFIDMVLNPKEEPCDNCNNDVCCCTVKEESKQETIKEAFLKTHFGDKISINSDIGKSFELGAECQKEQNKKLYSEEEVKRLMFDFYYDMSHKMNVPKNLISENATNVDEWFKQFKKK